MHNRPGLNNKSRPSYSNTRFHKLRHELLGKESFSIWNEFISHWRLNFTNLKVFIGTLHSTTSRLVWEIAITKFKEASQVKSQLWRKRRCECTKHLYYNPFREWDKTTPPKKKKKIQLSMWTKSHRSCLSSTSTACHNLSTTKLVPIIHVTQSKNKK